MAGLHAIRGVSILRAIEGEHAQAVRDLESILPVIRYAPPHVYFDLLNSYAVELGEVGRLQEAHNIARLVLASPFTFAYPEWRETNDEINRRRCRPRSGISLAGLNHFAASTQRQNPPRPGVSSTQPATPKNLLHLPERTAAEPPAPYPFQQPGSVTQLEDWKSKMVKAERDDDNGDLPIEEMTPSDLAMALIQLITDSRFDEAGLRKLLEYARKIYAEPEKPV